MSRTRILPCMATRGAVNGQVIAARKELGLTQVQFARRVKLNHADIVRMEHGWTPPERIRTRVARVLDVLETVLFPARP